MRGSRSERKMRDFEVSPVIDTHTHTQPTGERAVTHSRMKRGPPVGEPFAGPAVHKMMAWQAQRQTWYIVKVASVVDWPRRQVQYGQGNKAARLSEKRNRP